jgi:hypothetical protein
MSHGSLTHRTPADAKDIQYVQSRIASVVSNRWIVPFHGLIYRLCEVGPRRFDPRLLQNSIRLAADRNVVIRQARPGLFVPPGVHGAQLGWAVRRAMAVLHTINDPSRQGLLDHLVDVILDALNATAVTYDSPLAAPTGVTADIKLARLSAIRRATPLGRAPVIMWITHELPWIYPDDPRLWFFLRRADEIDARAIIVARKVSPATFALAKALKFRAVQYYATLVPSQTSDLKDAAQAIGWPTILDVPRLQAHAMTGYLRTVTDMFDPHTAPASERRVAQAAIRNGIEARLDQGTETSPATSIALLKWATTETLNLPRAWYDNVSSWIEPTPTMRPGTP